MGINLTSPRPRVRSPQLTEIRPSADTGLMGSSSVGLVLPRRDPRSTNEDRPPIRCKVIRSIETGRESSSERGSTVPDDDPDPSTSVTETSDTTPTPVEQIPRLRRSSNNPQTVGSGLTDSVGSGERPCLSITARSRRSSVTGKEDHPRPVTIIETDTYLLLPLVGRTGTTQR